MSNEQIWFSEDPVEREGAMTDNSHWWLFAIVCVVATVVVSVFPVI